MCPSRLPVSLVAERAVRYLREHPGPVNSLDLARMVLATRIPDEPSATKILETAFAGDPRLAYENGGWVRLEVCRTVGAAEQALSQPESDRVLVLIQGSRSGPGSMFVLRNVAAIRLQSDTVIAACGGEPAPGPDGDDLRKSMQETLLGAIPILHDPPGSLPALERWLDTRLDGPISLRRLGQVRLRLRAGHDLETLAARLGLAWRDTGDPLDLAEMLEAALEALRHPGEDLESLRAACGQCAPRIDWSRYAFDPSFLAGLPRVPGTYRFFDAEGTLLYVGKSRNLHQRVNSYFREGYERAARVQALVDAVHRIEVEPVGSDLEAVLREAADIRKKDPTRNVQRRIHLGMDREDRLRSILILEPATGPFVLWAYLLRDGRLLGRVGIGPRGGGLRRIERVLETRFFSYVPGPTDLPGPDLDVELVVRWLASHRDRVVAFDPTHLRSSREVIARLRAFLARGGPFEPDGTPIHVR